jgi:transglutaminase-like putative cysteine protease
MRLKIEHTTTFTYDYAVSEAYTELRLRPLDSGGQHCLAFALKIEPAGEVLAYTDRFGNDIRHFDLVQPHRQLRVAAQSEVLTPATYYGPSTPLSPLDEFDFLQATHYAPHTEHLAPLGAALDGHATPAAALALMSAVHGALAYEKGATTVTTTAPEALQLGRGVCQDFAHVLLALYRSRGLPARYVSGYLHDRHNGHAVAASHAWVDVYLAGHGWLSVDPTHNREQTEHYVRVAVGRDYADVPPTRGVFTGNAHEALDVHVRVSEI